MEIIIHKIRLLDVGRAPAFEEWVTTEDYAACPDLPSVRQFSVQRVSLDPAAPFHYFEVIAVTSMADFERDMALPAFCRLVDRFSAMAELAEEVIGTRLGAGYGANSRNVADAMGS
ncbi:hypothetical protein [Methylosinus sp. Sm6]|uniref:hypothetical protein n=1 Tax=Methylosinus sp. Sm6 TaxID=2866948 RepID=UPI001C99E881|nr:hypothetical protein [Methylosinus sp. Sm6]MBY6243033.1 hypothetical protein [Methylosinus sp. Sm6]